MATPTFGAGPRKPVNMKNIKGFIIAGAAIFAIVMVIIAFSSSFITIEAGFKGVLFKKFGGGLDKDNIYAQGFHVIAPWNTMYLYDTRILEKTEEMDVMAKNGLSIHIDLSFRYKVVDDKIGYLHEDIGRSFADKIVIPEIRSATRKVIGEYLPEELYSTKRDAIQTEIFINTEKHIAAKNLILDAVLIRSVRLPATIQAAIEAKLEQEQQAQQYTFKLDRAKQEAERQEIEAQGKATANRILNASLTNMLLQEKGIEATKALADSKNAKVIVIGNSKNGLPIILGDQ